MKKILVTTDFSGNSKAGVRFALQMEAQTGCELVFYHAVQIMKPTSWNDKRFENFSQNKISLALEDLRKFVTDICKQSKMSPANYRFIVETGTEVAAMAIRCAKKIKADLICLSTHGAGRLQKILGTHASDLITTSPVPVVTVPKKYHVKPLTDIFYASDFAAVKQELATVQKFADAVKAKINVYHYDYLLHVPENRKKLERKIAKLNSPNVLFNFRRQEIEQPLSDHLRRDIRKTNPSLVVLFTKQNRNWFDRLFLSSESSDLAFNSKVPLLTFRKKIKD